MSNNLTYKESGVNYDAMDPFKRACQQAAANTSDNAVRLGVCTIRASRGESAFQLQTRSGILSHVQEGLGTKSLVADAMYTLTSKSYYDAIGQDTVAMIVNDMITLLQLPVSVSMHLAAGDSNWFNDQQRTNDLINGWKNACDISRCVWAGGETPTLNGIINPATIELSGSGIGFSETLYPLDIEAGDAIVFLSSSGIHANGLTLARQIAGKLPGGYLTRLSDGRNYGESLLDPTHIYVGAVEDCLLKNFTIKYAVNITGHGWRKLMRLNKDLRYVIHDIPPVQPIFNFIKEHGNVTDEECYGNLNMGAGFALFVSSKEADAIVNYINSQQYGYTAMRAGTIEQGEKQVIIEPKNLCYKGDTLAVR